MLGRIAQGLEFVTGLRIGDRLPSEILTGEASWTADESHRDRAMARLDLQLIAWMSELPGGGSGPDTRSATREILGRAGQLPMSPDYLAAGLRRLSAQTPGLTPEETLDRIRRVADAYAHIDALRDQLLRGARQLGAVLDRLARGSRGDTTHKELLMQVRRLAATGVADLEQRFAAADHCVADMRAIAGAPDGVIAAIRRSRDALYVRARAWEPYTAEWATIEAGPNARTWHLAHDTYRFLAPRFMTTVEWLAAPRAIGPTRSGPPRSGMVW
jgi:hypothetical protein